MMPLTQEEMEASTVSGYLSSDDGGDAVEIIPFSMAAMDSQQYVEKQVKEYCEIWAKNITECPVLKPLRDALGPQHRDLRVALGCTGAGVSIWGMQAPQVDTRNRVAILEKHETQEAESKFLECRGNGDQAQQHQLL
jgi:hypothetical protein